MKDFQIDRYDEDFFEAECFENSFELLSEMIKGCSYDDIVIPRFCNLIRDTFDKKYNSVILIYDFKYDGGIKKSSDRANEFYYLGTVSYKK